LCAREFDEERRADEAGDELRPPAALDHALSG
jgi:hypothetical protein